MIINPWLFYLIGIAENVGDFLFTIGLIAIIGGVISSIISFCEDKIEHLKTFTKILILGIIFTFISMLIPSKETSYRMLAASLTTKENIEYVTETGKDIVDYIVESANIIIKNEQMRKNHSTGD